jgi:outer membrane protein assembly factor BamB
LPSNIVGIRAAAGGAKIMVKFSDGSVVVNPVVVNCGGAERAAQQPAGVSAVGRPEIRWATNMGGNTFMTSPLLAGDLVMSATTDDDSASVAAIHALARESGNIRWSFKTKNSVKNNMALWEGAVFACDVEGNVYAIDAASGKLKWSKALRQNSVHPVYTQGIVVSNGVIYAGQGNFLTALQASDGKVLWVNEAWKGGVSTVASPVVDEKSGVLLTAAYWTGRFAHDITTGKLLWEKRDDDTRISDNSPVVFGGHFFYASPGYITEVDPRTGEEYLKFKISYVINSNSRPLVTDKYYITGTADKGVVAFDRTAGYKELWNFRTNPAIFYTAPYTKDFQMTVESGVALNGNELYFGANDGFLYCVDVRNGTFRWRLNLGAPILCNIVIDGGVLYFTEFGGNMWAIRL